MPAKKKNTKSKFNPTDSLSQYYIKVENPRKIFGLYTTEFSGFTPDNIHYYLEAARKGLVYWKSLFFDEILRRDLRFGAINQTRLYSVANKEWKLSYKSDSPVPKSKQEDTIKFLKDNLQQIMLPSLISRITKAQITGVTATEIIYKQNGSRIYWDEFVKIPTHLLGFDDIENKIKILDADKIDTIKLRNMGWTPNDRIDLSAVTLEDIDPRKLIIAEALDGDAQNPFMNGCWDSLIWAHLCKNYGLKDWSIWIERFATPSVLGKTPPLMSPIDKEKVNKAVQMFGHLFRGIIPNTAEIELLAEANRGDSSNVFSGYVEYWNKEATIRELGQNLTTDIGNVGSKAAVQGHDVVRKDIGVGDMMTSKYKLNKTIKILLDLNESNIIDYPEWGFEEEEDIEYKLKRSVIIKNLKDSGWKVIQENIEEEFKVKVDAVEVNNNNPPPNDSTQNYIKQFIKESYELHR